jgi:hypothetical protein
MGGIVDEKPIAAGISRRWFQIFIGWKSEAYSTKPARATTVKQETSRIGMRIKSHARSISR